MADCPYCGAEIKCGHERKIARLKEALKYRLQEVKEAEAKIDGELARFQAAVKEAESIFKGFELDERALSIHDWIQMKNQWLAKYGERREYAPEEDEFPA